MTESSYKHRLQIDIMFKPGRPSPTNPKPAVAANIVFEPAATGGITPMPRTRTLGRFPGIDANGHLHPTPNIAVGPRHLVQVVNTGIAWFETDTGIRHFQVPIEPITGDAEGFFESLGISPFVFDPKVLFDPVTQHFIFVALEFGPADVMIAVSVDANPNGDWAKYRFEAKPNLAVTDLWLDYPGFGCNKDAVAGTGNVFPFSGAADDLIRLSVAVDMTVFSGAAAFVYLQDF